jgi:hypothetical protein
VKSRTEIEALASNAAAALVQVRTDLTGARKAAVVAENRWLDDGSRKAAEARREALDAVDRHVELEKRALAAYEKAAARLASLDREDRLRELERLRAELSGVDDDLALAGAKFAALDRAVDELVLATAAKAVAAAEAHDRAKALAAELRVPDLLPRKLTLADACLAVQRHVTRVRDEEGRDPVAPHWLATAPDAGDWKRAGYTAAELEATQREVARARRDEHEAELFAKGALFVANAQPPTESKTQTTETVQ